MASFQYTQTPGAQAILASMGFSGAPAPRMSTGGNYTFDLNQLKGDGTTTRVENAETGQTVTDPFIRIADVNGEPLLAFKVGDQWQVHKFVDTDSGMFGGRKHSKYNGVLADTYGADGSFKSATPITGREDAMLGPGVGSLLTMAGGYFGGGALAAGAAGAAGTTAAATAAGTTAAEIAAAETLAGAGLGFGGGGAALGTEALAAYAGLSAPTLEAMAAAMGMTPEAFVAAGAGGVGAAGAAAGQLAGTAAGSVAGGAAGGAGSLATAAGSLIPGGWQSLITPALQLIGGAYTASKADDASDAMVGAANNGIAENRRQFDLVRGLLQPYVDAGTGALGSYQSLSGLKGAGAQQTEIDMLRGTPQFASLAQQGEDAILQNASATGGLRGGNTQGALATQRTNLLSALIDKQLGRYGGLIDVGQRSAAGVGSAAMTTGANNSNLMQQAGAAEAGGIVAGTNAITNAVGNVGGFFAGQGAMTPPQVSQYGTGVAAPGQVRF